MNKQRLCLPGALVIFASLCFAQAEMGSNARNKR